VDKMQQLKKFSNKLLGFLPQPLPHKGLSDFDQYCDLIFETYDLPDLPSYRNAIASMIMHLGPSTAMKAPYFFAICVRKAMANQIAYEKIQLLKKEEAEYIEKTEFKGKTLNVEGA
jgi:hypothetical protein